MGEPESNRYWFPGYDAPNDLRTTEFIATVDRPLLALSNGRLVETRTNADGTRTFHWKAETPYANHLTSFVVGEYVDVPQRFEGVELHNFGYPNETAAVAASVERLPEMVAFFSDLTGVKSPFSQYSQVFVQDLPWGIGSHGLAVQSENMVDDDRTHADFLYLWDGLEAEALAHQWFGNYLTCRDWSHVWLNRGFAHYFDGLYNAHKNGREEFLLWQVLGDQATYLADWRAGVRHPIVTPHYEDAPGFVGDNYSYVRGASVLHLLRRHLGDETWRRAVRRYLQANAHRPVVTEDFRRAVEEASGEPMDWFFDQWLYRMGHPVFDVAWRHDAAKQQLILTVRQTQQIDPKEPYPQVEFFQGAVEIEIDEAIERVWLAPKAENVFTFARPRSPQLVHFDYESAWIKELRFEKPLDELLHQLKHDRDILGRRWAIDELGARAADGKTSAADRERICAGLREAILGPSYWRLRLAALSQLQSLLAPAAQPQPAVLDDATIAMLLIVIRNETSWNRAAAIGFLGMTRDPRHAELYLRHLDDPSDRVIGAAALALGRSRSPAAFAALAALVRKPSWKNQSLMSALNGLRELGDPRGFEIAFGALSDLSLFRWRLPTPPVWDLRVFATQTLAALGRADAAYPLLAGRLDKALAEDDLEGAFNNALLLVLLADPRAQADLDRLKLRFRDDENDGEVKDEKFKGKIGILDPRSPGAGTATWAFFLKTKGEEWLRRLAGQELFLSRDQRQLADSLAKGKVAITIVLTYYTFSPFLKAGLPVKPLPDMKEGTYTSCGSSATSIVKNSPHPNATKVFVNWLFSKEGQEIYGKAMGQATRRLDVDTKWTREFGHTAAKEILTPENFDELENGSEEVVNKYRKPAMQSAEKLFRGA